MNYNKLKGMATSKGTTLTKMCNDLGIEFSTLWRQCKSGKLSIATVKKIVKCLGLTQEETRYVFFED